MKSLITILLLCFSVAAFSQSGNFTTLKARTSFQIGSTQKVTGINGATWGADSTNAAKLASINAINIELNRRLTLLYNYINTAEVINTDGTIFTDIDGLLKVNPSVRKENFTRITTQNFTIGASDVNILYDYSGGGGTVTLPSLSATTDKNVYFIKNPTSGSLTYNNAVWIDNATSTTTLASGKWVKLCVDNVAGKIWIAAGGTL